VSTRKVDDLVRALGAGTGISKSEVSRICADLDAEVAVFRDRGLAGQAFPYVFLDDNRSRRRAEVPPRTQSHPGVPAGQEPGVLCCRGLVIPA
jgi:transposase-like protein